MIKANEPLPSGVNMVILRQVPTVALSSWLVSTWYHVEVEVGIRVCATQLMFWPGMELIRTSMQ